MKLIICDNPHVSASISAALNAKERGEGFLYGNNYIIVLCYEHWIKLADADVYNENYKNWKLNDLPIIPDEWQYTAIKDKKEQLKIIADLMKRADIDEIINACDAGRESDLIFKLIYNYCQCSKPTKRLWLNSLEESAIINGFKNLRDASEYDNLYKSALCRVQADWIIGCNLTRLFSLLYGNGVTLKIGRVISPTLALIVERENEIENFIKEPFYTVELNCGDFNVVRVRHIRAYSDYYRRDY